jgi:hypothetical protein
MFHSSTTQSILLNTIDYAIHARREPQGGVIRTLTEVSGSCFAVKL